MTPRYFDFNATTPLLPEVVDAMMPFLTTHFGNPSSGHSYGRAAKAAVEAARAQVAALVDAEPSEIIFTSGGTEATALALRGALSVPGAHVVTTKVEHPATARVVDALMRSGARVTRLGVDALGVLRADEAKAALERRPRLMTVIHAHNETGVLQPLIGLSVLTKAHGVLLHVDASQSAGKVPLSVREDGVDLMTLAAHKLYGPKGVGALVVRSGVTLVPQQLGAGHENGMRAGTENVASIVGFGAACVAAKRDLADQSTRLRALRERLIAGLKSRVPGILIAGERTERLPNTVYALFPMELGSAVLARCPGIAASTGSACHDGHEAPPQVLLEMGFSEAAALGAVRLSMGRSTTEADVDAAISELSAT